MGDTGREVPLSVKLAGAAETVVKRKVQAKLEHYLPTATDSVLCDYVLVMVGNRKTSRQVAIDLEAFLGPDEADEFVTWLWELLLTVENKTLDLSGEAPAPEPEPAPAAVAEPRREERRSRSPPRRDQRDRRRSRSRDRERDGGRSKVYSHTRSRSRSRDRGAGRREEADRRGGRNELEFRRRDDFDGRDQDWGYSRGGRQGGGGGGPGGGDWGRGQAPPMERRVPRAPMTSRLLMEAVKSQGQAPLLTRGNAGGGSSYHDGVHSEEVPHHAVGLRSDTIIEETRKHLLHKQQQELQQRRAQLQQAAAQEQQPPPMRGGAVGGFGNLAGTDLRNLLSKGRGGTGPRPGGFGGSGGISSRLGPVGGSAFASEAKQEEQKQPPAEEGPADGQGMEEGVDEGDDEEEVSFNVTMPAAALAAPNYDDDDTLADEVFEEGGEEDVEDAAGFYSGYRGRGGFRGRGAAFRGRGGRGGSFAPGVRGRGGFKARGGIRGRGRGGGPVETFAAKKWVNPALAAAAGNSGGSGACAAPASAAAEASAGGGAGAAAASTASADNSKVHRPVVGKLNLDGDLDTVGKRGLYKAAKWVKAS